MALVNKGVVQQRTGAHESAIAAWDDVLDGFSSDPDDQTGDLVAAAMVRKAGALTGAGSNAEAHAVLDKVLLQFDGAKDPGVRVQLSRALTTRAIIELEDGRPLEALGSSERLEREFADVDDDGLVWRARCNAAAALIALGDLDKAHAGFREAYRVFEPVAGATRQMLHLVSAALAAGIPAQNVAKVLSADEEKAELLTPLIVALLQECAEDVRAPEEVLEVAADIRAAWHDEA